MPMQAESLEVLENASVAPAQARAIVRAIEIEIAGAKDTLATKRDHIAMTLGFSYARSGADTVRCVRTATGVSQRFVGSSAAFT